MKTEILFALASLLFAGINDIVFKKYSRKVRSRGMYILGIGVVWVSMQAAVLKINPGTILFDSTSVSFGLLSGAFLVISNILLLECFTHIDVSLGSTVYRLNTIGVVLLSFFLLGESMGTMKVLGIVSGIIAVFFLYQRSRQGMATAHFPLFFTLTMVAAFMRALYGVTTKAALIRHADPWLLLFIVSLFWIAGGAAYALIKEKRFRLTGKKVLYSVVSGSLVFLIANFLMLAVERGQASVVIPIANMSFIVALFISATLKMERLTAKKGLAMTFAVFSIILLSMV